MTETAVHRRTAPTRLEALSAPVLMDIPATGSLVQVTNTRLCYIFAFFAANYYGKDRILLLS